MTAVQVMIQKLPHGCDLPLPQYATAGSAGVDLLAAVSEDTVIASRAWQAIPCGIAIALPPGYEAQIRARSGLAVKHGVTCLNAPGTIDSDYRGEIKAILINHSLDNFTVTRGMRIAQMVIAEYKQIAWQESDELPDTERPGGRTGGFGSTGLH